MAKAVSARQFGDECQQLVFWKYALKLLSRNTTNDNTPLLDIKPYTPSLDRIESPDVPAWCSHWPKSLEESAHFEWEKEFNF